MADTTSSEHSLASSANPDDWRPRWQQKDAWTLREFAQLCCGWNPDHHEFPDRERYNEALDSVNRAVRVKAIPTVELSWPPTGAERLLDSVPMFEPQAVGPWAAKHYSRTFPWPPDTWKDSASGSRLDRPLGARERATLLTIIAALAKKADIDLSQPSKASLQIEHLTVALSARVSARSIEDHLKEIPDALERRSKSS